MFVYTTSSNSLRHLSEENLYKAYETAIQLKLEPEFIYLLKTEIKRRSRIA
ncbi:MULTISPECIES: sporulation histidine kinase inhibitor Sda [Bacillaceae]|uniref:sporulation histidine kinase inhibitor Sda n=1 Tax=Bacillaceae TaxID=186817 RepID=UPI0009FD50F2|nr:MULTISPECIES: sporulation histidine kinase inhibitor Sda [Bacillaceae]UOE95722.1 sporulation histidine kinase inhibitor Sda [Alkalihalobacillus sp. LMS39]